MIDFDDLISGADEEFARDPSAPVVAGLVVSERARHGNDLVIETQAFIDSTRGLPLVAFIETADDDPNVAIFANSADYQRAMDRIRAPTEEEALAWEAQRISERLERWADRLAEIGL
jgi:hypothetical protein